MSKFAVFGAVAALSWPGLVAANAEGWGGLLGGPPDRGAWCLRYDIGAGVVNENCRFVRFEDCNYERALWGTTASCTQNPHFLGYSDKHGPRRSKKHRR
jgi:hypothetical protein